MGIDGVGEGEGPDVTCPPDDHVKTKYLKNKYRRPVDFKKLPCPQSVFLNSPAACHYISPHNIHVASSVLELYFFQHHMLYAWLQFQEYEHAPCQ